MTERRALGLAWQAPVHTEPFHPSTCASRRTELAVHPERYKWPLLWGKAFFPTSQDRRHPVLPIQPLETQPNRVAGGG